MDNTGLAPTDTGGAARPDYADDDATSASPAEVDVLSSLTKRRGELDARERALAMRESVLSAGEARVDQKIATLKDLQTQIQALLAQRDAKQDAQIASLVKTYSTMKSKDAARIFNSLSDDVLIPVAKGMKSDVLAPVLAAMNPDAAQKLTIKLAALLKLPDTTPAAVCPAPTADAAAPAPVASAAPPVQTAALTPPPATPLATPAAAPPQATPPKPAPAKAPPPKATAATTPKPEAAAPAAAAPASPAAGPPAK
jgi:flagellar motility protein MotE (MotC chaperone)